MNKYTKETLGETMSEAAFYDFFRRIQLRSEDGITLKAELEADSVKDILTIQESPGVTFTGTESTDTFKINVDYDLYSPLGTTAIRLQDLNSNTKDINLTAGSNMIITRLADDEIKFIATSTGDTAEIAAITQTNPVVITTTEIHGFARHISVIPVEIQGMTELNGNQYFVDIISDIEIALYTDPELTTSVDGTGFTAYTNSGLVIADRVLDSLDQLKDTDIQNPFDDQVLRYNGTSWVPEILDPDSLGGNRVFVSAEKGDDANDGILYPVATVKRACEIASGLVYDAGGNIIRNITIMVATGDYVEQNPIIVPDNVSIIGDNLRRVLIRPGNPKQDIFRVRNGSYINGVTFRDAIDGSGVPVDTFRYAISFDDVLDTTVSRVAYTNLPSTRPRIFTSPYMQNCSLISFLGGNGVEIDGNLIDTPNTPPNDIEAENPVNLVDGIPEQGKSMVANALTILSFGGNAWRVINDAYAQIVSCFVIFTENGCLTQNGGYLSITNSASNFGLFSLRSTGYSPNSFEFDRGWISSNGVNEGLQTLTAVGLKRGAIEHFVIRIRNIGNTDITDNFNSNSTLGVEETLIPSIANVGSNTVTFPAPHGFENGDEVEYDANSNIEIIGLLNETTYFVSVVDTDTIALYHDAAQTKPIRDLDASIASGTHIFRTKFEEFYVNDIVETHNVYQDLQLPVGTYTIAIGDRILGTNGASVVSADIADWNPTTRVLTVSINRVQVGNDQVRNQFASGSTINAGEISIGAVTITTATTRNDLYTSEFTLLSSVSGRTMQNIASTVQQRINLHRPSICNSSAHTWEYSGSGTDYNALPQNGGQTDEFFEQVSTEPGRVYSSGTNEIGDFKVGDFVRAFNRTGNINFKNKVTIGELDSLALSLSSGVIVNEISTDIELGDNEVDGAKHSRLVTQLAARSFLDNRLGNFIDKQLSTNAIPSAVVQLNSSGQINAELIPPQGNFNSYTVNAFEGRTELHNDIPANDLIPGDIVIEEYQETVLTVTGSVTVIKGETITQANSGASGVAKSDYTGTDLRLVDLEGTFNTTDQLSGSTSGALGANSVPVSVSGPNNIVDNYFLKKSRQSQFLILDNTQTYDFTDIISNQTALKGAVSGAIATVDTHTVGVLTGVDFLSLPNGNGYTTPGTYRDIDIIAVTGVGTGALADVTVNGGGQITSFDIKRGGSGYADGDTITVNDSSVGGRAGGTQFQISVTEVENRLYISLNQDAGLEFNANSVNLDFIIDDNVTPFTITDQTATTQLTFNAQDIGSGGSVDSINNQIVFGSAHGYTNGDPVEYDSNSNVVLGGLSNNGFYYVKVIDAATIELYNDYSLAPASLVNILSTGTGTHILRIYAVSIDEDRFYFESHSLSTGDAVRLDATDPSAPINDEDYLFVGGVTTNSFTLHSARGAALDSVNGLIVGAVDVTDTGSGSIIIEQQNVLIVGDVNTSGQDLNNWSSLSTSTVDAQNIVSGIIDPVRLGTGSANDTTFLRGDSQYVFAVQGITNTTTDDPITLTGSSYNDGLKDIYYDIVDLRVELAGYDNPVAPSSGTERVGVAAFDFDHFVIDANGKVATKSSGQGGVIDADTLDSQQGSYYTNPINLSRTVPVEKGGTNIAAMTQGDLLYAATNIGDGNFDDVMSTLAIGNNNDVLVVSSGLPAWSNVLTLESVTVNNIQIAVTGDNEIDTLSGNLTIDSAGGTTTLDDAVSVTGTLGVTGESTLASAIISDLTAGRVVLAGTGSAVEDSANLTFDGTTLNVTGSLAVDNVTVDVNTINTSTGNLTIDSAGGTTTLDDAVSVTGTLGVTGESTLASAIISDLTAGRVVLAGTSGAVEDSENLTFDGTTLTVTGDLVVDNVTIDVNTISTSTGNLIIDSNGGTVTVDDNLSVNGDLTVVGTTTTINTETIALADNIIILNSNEASTPTQNSGIEIERGTEENRTLVWDETVDKWTIGSETFVAGTVEANITGNITGNVDGTVSDISNHNTSNLAEDPDATVTSGTMYFTQARARAAVSNGGDLSYNPTTGVFSVTTYKSGDFDTDFGNKSTTDLSEGTNLYFTTARMDAHLSGGAGVDYTTGAISIGQAVGTTDSVTFNTVTANVAATDATVLVDATNKTVNLDGTVAGHIIPDTNIAYDLGSETARFRDLYLSGTTINLGGVDISSDGITITLPQAAIAGGGTVLDSTNSDTDNLSEGATNRYYTDTRARAAISATGDINYNSTTGEISFTQTAAPVTSVNSLTGAITLTTDNIGEGTTNLYYTNARVGDVVTKAFIDNLNVDADTLDSLNSLDFLRSNADANFNSLTNTRFLYISRNGSSSNEFTRFGRDDGTTFIYTRNDEAVSNVRFDFVNTDTEANNGLNANSSFITLAGDISGASISVDGNTVWHSGNDGTGSGLDADTLDGIQASQFLRSDAIDIIDAGNQANPLVIRRSSASANQVGIRFDIPSVHARYFGVGTDTEPYWSASADLSTGNKVWHAGNDGSGSGLDADLLDSLDSTAFLRSNADNTSATGDIRTSGNIIEAGLGSGSVAMTVNDGYGNANITFNHSIGVPDFTGSSARITSSVDSATAGMVFQLKDSTTSDVAVGLSNILGMSTSSITAYTNVLPNTNNTRNLGTASLKWNTVYATLFSGTALEAYYADLAENYEADAAYNPGTVVVFGGEKEVTVTDQFQDCTAAGVVSTNPAYLMNKDQQGEHVVAIALQGRVPCCVIGPVRKGQMLVTSSTPGYAEAAINPGVGTVIGKSLVNKTTNEPRIIEVVVGKH